MHTNRFSNAYEYVKQIWVTIRNIIHRQSVQKVAQKCSKNKHLDNIRKIGNIIPKFKNLCFNGDFLKFLRVQNSYSLEHLTVNTFAKKIDQQCTVSTSCVCITQSASSYSYDSVMAPLSDNFFGCATQIQALTRKSKITWYSPIREKSN